MPVLSESQQPLGSPMSYAASDANRRRLISIVLILCAAMAALTLAQTRELFLDDTFIHLRIAVNLATHGVYSFNGVTPTYSNSSPFYTALLAALWRVLPSIWLPKIVGVAAYAGLLVVLALQLRRSRGPAQTGIYLTWIIAISSPMAIRWLTDGMETVLVAMTSVALGGAVAGLRTETDQSHALFQWRLCLLAAIATGLRVESAYLIALVVVAFAADALWQRSRLSRPVSVSLIYLVVGSLLSLLAVRGYFGYLLPDTAVAKAGAGTVTAGTVADTLVGAIKAHLAASLFGVGIFASWLASLWLGWRARAQRVFIAAINAGLPVLLALIALRHQAVQGYRYFVFIEFFLLACNAALITPQLGSELRPRQLWGRPIVLALTAMVVAWVGYDYRHLEVISAGRSATFKKFLQDDLTDLRGKRGLAWDVGMIGYFSQSTILDANGLVNGREIARLRNAERLQRLSAMPLDFVFADAGQLAQLAQLAGHLEFKRWSLRGEYQFPNFSGDPDTHYLLVRNSTDIHDAAPVRPHP